MEMKAIRYKSLAFLMFCLVLSSPLHAATTQGGGSFSQTAGAFI